MDDWYKNLVEEQALHSVQFKVRANLSERKTTVNIVLPLCALLLVLQSDSNAGLKKSNISMIMIVMAVTPGTCEYTSHRGHPYTKGLADPVLGNCIAVASIILSSIDTLTRIIT